MFIQELCLGLSFAMFGMSLACVYLAGVNKRLRISHKLALLGKDKAIEKPASERENK